MRLKIELINGTQIDAHTNMQDPSKLMYDLIDDQIKFLFFDSGAVRKEEIALIYLLADEDNAKIDDD